MFLFKKKNKCGVTMCMVVEAIGELEDRVEALEARPVAKPTTKKKTSKKGEK